MVPRSFANLDFTGLSPEANCFAADLLAGIMADPEGYKDGANLYQHTCLNGTTKYNNLRE